MASFKEWMPKIVSDPNVPDNTVVIHSSKLVGSAFTAEDIGKAIQIIKFGRPNSNGCGVVPVLKEGGEGTFVITGVTEGEVNVELQPVDPVPVDMKIDMKKKSRSYFLEAQARRRRKAQW